MTLPPEPSRTPPPSSGWMPPAKTRRQVLALGLWGLACAALYPLGPSYKFIIVMPLGLFGYFTKLIDGRDEVFVGLGWAVYVVVLGVYFGCRTARVFWWTCAVLALLLALNVGGCFYVNHH